MKKLDIYIIKKYLVTFVYTVLILTTIICMVDFTENNDDFISKDAPYFEILFTYYLNYYPYLVNFLSPITIFIATIMVTARLASHTEIIAMLSSGMSFARILVPYFIGASLLSVIIFFMLGWGTPNSNKKRVAFENKYLKNSSKTIADRNIHLKVGDNLYAYLKSYNADIGQAKGFTLEHIEFTPEGPQLKEKITAKRARWDEETNKWKLIRYEKRVFIGEKQIITSGGTLDTLIKMTPEDFVTEYGKRLTLTSTELYSYIEELKEKGSTQVQEFIIEKYERLFYPLAIFVLTFIGVCVSARKSREGIGYQIAFGFALALIYILFVQTGRQFAEANVISPIISVLMPNIIFVIVGVFMYRRVPK
ncbi:MAG: LptF/LptG family permease [Cyclobacteriaceae bacterium]